MIRTNNNSNFFLGQFRNLSPILNPRQRSERNGIFNENSVADLKARITLIGGTSETPGKFWNASKEKHEVALLAARKNDLAAVEELYKDYVQKQLNSGNQAPSEWPPELAAKKQEVEARIQVHEEELAWLKDKLKAAEELEESIKPDKNSAGLFANKAMWGISKLRDGILDSIAGQKCEVNKAGVLYISDEKSPYFGLQVWKFKSLVTNPMFEEYRLRCRIEEKTALAENRPRKIVKFPGAPSYDKKSGNIEYPAGYSSKILQKIKQIV